MFIAPKGAAPAPRAPGSAKIPGAPVLFPIEQTLLDRGDEKISHRHPERFDPREESGRLIDSEHRARYRWAASAVAGKEVLDAGCGSGYGIGILAEAGAAAVTGVDIAPAAVAESTAQAGSLAKEIREADLRELPFEENSFDVIVCFETIEHIDGAQQALLEMRRVLRKDGILIVSSPNPDAYLGGNEHHVHEYRPEALSEAVGALFSQVALHRQDPWVGSTIQPSQDQTALDEILRTSATDSGEPTYGIVIASDAPLPELPGVLAFGDALDVRWWAEQLAHSKGETAAALEREAQTQKRLEETSAALLDANQSLAQVPLLRHRLAEFEQLHTSLSDHYHRLLHSKSWRVTAPLRRMRRGS